MRIFFETVFLFFHKLLENIAEIIYIYQLINKKEIAALTQYGDETLHFLVMQTTSNFVHFPHDFVSYNPLIRDK